MRTSVNLSTFSILKPESWASLITRNILQFRTFEKLLRTWMYTFLSAHTFKKKKRKKVAQPWEGMSDARSRGAMLSPLSYGTGTVLMAEVLSYVAE